MQHESQAMVVWYKQFFNDLEPEDQTHQPILKRALIVLLLLLSCISAMLLLWQVEPVENRRLTSAAQIDSLITLAFNEFGVSSSQVRQQTVQIDSVFSRNIYTVRVPSHFSKTSLHLRLHELAWPYSVQTMGHVQFPERNLRVHLLYNDIVHRSVYINTDSRLNLTAD